MNTEVRKKEKKDFFKLMNHAVFGKGLRNVRKERYQACNKAFYKGFLSLWNEMIMLSIFKQNMWVWMETIKLTNVTN